MSLAVAGTALVGGGPGAPLGFLLGDATALVAFLDMLGLALLRQVPSFPIDVGERRPKALPLSA